MEQKINKLKASTPQFQDIYKEGSRNKCKAGIEAMIALIENYNVWTSILAKAKIRKGTTQKSQKHK